MKLNAYLAKSTAVAALGELLFGFDTAVISGTTSTLTQTYHLSPALLGVTVATVLRGFVRGSRNQGSVIGGNGEEVGHQLNLDLNAIQR